MLYEKSKPLGKEINQKINEFGELSDQIDLIKSQLDELKRKYSTIEDELRPLLIQLKQTEQKHLKSEKYLVTIKRMGFDRTTMKYKTAFNQALTKVNNQTKKVLEQILDETKQTNRIVSSIGVSRLKENIITKMIKRIMMNFKKFLNPLKKTNKGLDDLNKLLSVISK